MVVLKVSKHKCPSVFKKIGLNIQLVGHFLTSLASILLVRHSIHCHITRQAVRSVLGTESNQHDNSTTQGSRI